MADSPGFRIGIGFKEVAVAVAVIGLGFESEESGAQSWGREVC